MAFSTLRDGTKIPRVGLGTWESPTGAVAEAIKQAFDIGYRHFDLAWAIFDSKKAKREDLWITSKLWNSEHIPSRVIPALRETLAELGLSYLDLYLIHWPVSFAPNQGWFPKGPDGKILLDPKPPALIETWREMEKAVEIGLVKHIGVSNVNCALLNDLYSAATKKPEVLQVELHPYLQQGPLIEFARKLGVHVTGYSPLIRLGSVDAVDKKGRSLNITIDPVIVKIAQKHKKTPAQIALRWNIQRAPNVSIIPKSTKIERLRENFQILDFELDDNDLKEISALDRKYRVCYNLDLIGVPVFD
ncbi:MAG: putative Alcohol dehydrogenase [Streblomastix strix]|uniref:Putative Alcohol dehydrogenase n=1 Tax=Streblomastix strix TaxID=222440 RepID=A0A5J4VF45_9EUKA|nr:MAG: putative Alcohol dehydrogenase [Streblomastix strix]